MALEFAKVHPNGAAGFVIPADKILGSPRLEAKTEEGAVQKLSDFLFDAAAHGKISRDTVVHVYTSGKHDVDLRFPPVDQQPVLAAQ